MRRLMQIFMVLFVICLTADAQTFSENFTGLTTGTNLAGQSSWTKGGTGPDVTVANATPLTYPLYNSGGGEYVVMPAGNATASRVYKTFAVPQTNYTGTTFYYSFLLNLTTAVDASVGYFMSLGVSGTSTSYGAKLFAKKNGAGYNIGLSKTSNTAVFGSTVLELNKTYLIVVRYTFNAAGLNAPEKYDDVAYLWVNPQGPAEPSAASAECTVPAAGTDTDMDGFSVLTDVGNIVWHNRGVTNPSGAFDGILVGHGTTSAQAWTNLNAGLVQKFDDPQSLTVKNADGAVTLDGKLDEADWTGAPTLVFGNGAYLNKQAGESTVTGGADIKASFDSYNVTYHKPNTDSSVTRVKFLRKGTDLFIGLSSNDKSICRFDWEGDGLFLKVKNSAGVDKEYKLYYQNIAGKSADTMRLEEAVLNSSAGVGVLATGSTANDTTNVDNGYTAEFKLKLASLGFDASTTSLQVAMSIFDPDGFQFDSTLPWPYGMMPFDSARGSYYKSWWGSEWGGTYRTLALTPEYDNPDTINTVTALTVTLDGKLDEAEWASAPALVFGPANAPKSGTDKTVTNGVDVKASFDSYNVTYHMPYKDTSYARVKFIQKGMNLYIGITSNDKSICKFDWEGDGMFLMIKNSAGVVKQYKLYYQNLNDTIRYEEDILNSGAGAGYLFTGSKVNDTTQVDAGYSAELMVKLGSLGYDQNVKTLPIALNVFDPDGYQHPMAAWDSARGSFYKSWWGSEWGSAFKTVKLQTITSVANGTDAVPTVYALSQNYPNPFNPTTMIKFSVPQASLVKIVVYDLIGREVATLVNGTYTPGFYNIPFNAQHVASGMYLYRMTSTSLGGAQTTFTDTKKLMLVK